MRTWIAIVTAGVLAGLGGAVFAATPNQVDDFQDGTAQNWADGQGTPANTVATGGPAGANDKFMQIGGTSHLVILNRSQWAGDFTSILAISMQLRNETASAKPMRIALNEDIIGGSSRSYVSTNAFNLPADNAWHLATFNLNTASLTALNGADPLPTALANIHEMRIVSSTGVSFVGDSAAGPVDVDNITALAPEPSALALAVMACAMAQRRRR